MPVGSFYTWWVMSNRKRDKRSVFEVRLKVQCAMRSEVSNNSHKYACPTARVLGPARKDNWCQVKRGRELDAVIDTHVTEASSIARPVMAQYSTYLDTLPKVVGDAEKQQHKEEYNEDRDADADELDRVGIADEICKCDA